MVLVLDREVVLVLLVRAVADCIWKEIRGDEYELLVGGPRNTGQGELNSFQKLKQ